ncbi:MAG: acyltransferase family protein [Porticoccaceae bacterium]
MTIYAAESRCAPSELLPDKATKVRSAAAAGIRPGDTDHDLYLDWLRGLAAVIVFVTHVRGGYFVQWSDLDPGSKTWINYFLFGLTRLGREAVIVFFVLSGYLVGGQAILANAKGRFSLRSYFSARVARLYTVLIPALVLTALFDHLRGAWTEPTNGWIAFVANLAFLQGIQGEPYGSNAPLWSLAYEWWFYVLFGLGAAVAIRLSKLTRIAAGLMLAGCIMVLWLKNLPVLLMFPIWLCGVAIRGLPVPRRPGGWLLATSLLALTLALGASSLLRDMRGDYLVGIATAFLIVGLRGVPPVQRQWFSLGRRLAAMSFSLYAVHYPLNALILGRFVPSRLSVADPTAWVSLLVLALGMASICFLVYASFERHTPRMRAWLYKRMPEVV